MADAKIWSGRFRQETDELMEKFSLSLPFDRLLFDADIAVNKAWARALVRAGVYTEMEADQVRATLDEIQKDFHSSGQLSFPESAEDIHSANEYWLTERLGDLGARIHTGRSRNDQVVTDFRLYLLEKNKALQVALHDLQTALYTLSLDHVKTVFPGQTHLRQAQPVSFAHYVLALFFQCQRDKERLQESYDRCSTMPLGSGALAGAAFDIDRNELAKELGFERVSENSYDATSDRDFVNEILANCAQVMIHLSRVAEDFIIWSGEGFEFLQIDDKYATGSSMMPQKKNPDSLELIRGKSARVIGNQVTALALLKGTPTAYVRDLQEDKEPVFDSLKQTLTSVRILTGVIFTLKVNVEKMRAALDPALYATDMADYLVRKGVPFRQSHHIVGNIVSEAERQGKDLNQLSLKDMQKYSELFENDIFSIFNPIASLEKRNLFGGTGSKSVKKQIEIAKKLL